MDNIDWETRHKLKDLLDDLVDESLSMQYNGWWRWKDPVEARKEIDAIIDKLTENKENP